MINKTEISIGGAVLAYYGFKKWYDRISAFLESIADPLVNEVEKLAKDGKIDKADRKWLAMKAIALLEERKTIKLNFISRFLISRVIDRVAEALPDFNVSKDVVDIVSEAKVK